MEIKQEVEDEPEQIEIDEEMEEVEQKEIKEEEMELDEEEEEEEDEEEDEGEEEEEEEEEVNELNYDERYADDFEVSDCSTPPSSPPSRRKKVCHYYPKFDRLPETCDQEFDEEEDDDDYEPCEFVAERYLRIMTPHVVENYEKAKAPSAIQVHMKYRRLRRHVLPDVDFKSPYKKRRLNRKNPRLPVGYVPCIITKQDTKNVKQYLDQKKREKADRKLARRRNFERKVLQENKKKEEERKQVQKLEELGIHRKQLAAEKHELFTMLKDCLHQEQAYKQKIEDEKKRMEIIEFFRNDELTVGTSSSSSTLIQNGKSAESSEQYCKALFNLLPKMVEEKRLAVLEAEASVKALDQLIMQDVQRNGKLVVTEQELIDAVNEVTEDDDELNADTILKQMRAVVTIVDPLSNTEVDPKYIKSLHEKSLRDWHKNCMNNTNSEQARTQRFDLQFRILEKIPLRRLTPELLKDFPKKLSEFFMAKKVDEEMKMYLPDAKCNQPHRCDMSQMTYDEKMDMLAKSAVVRMYKQKCDWDDEEWSNSLTRHENLKDFYRKKILKQEEIAESVGEGDDGEDYVPKFFGNLAKVFAKQRRANEQNLAKKREEDAIRLSEANKTPVKKWITEDELREIVRVQLEKAKEYDPLTIQRRAYEEHAMNDAQAELVCLPSTSPQESNTFDVQRLPPQPTIQANPEPKIEIIIDSHPQVQIPKFISPKQEPVQQYVQNVIQPIAIIPQMLNVPQPQMQSPHQMLHPYVSPQPQFAQPQMHSPLPHPPPKQQPQKPQFIQQPLPQRPTPQQPQYVAPQYAQLPQAPIIPPQLLQLQQLRQQQEIQNQLALLQAQEQLRVIQQQNAQPIPQHPPPPPQQQQQQQPFVPFINPLWNQYADLQIINVFGPAFAANASSTYQPVVFNQLDREIKQEIVTPPPGSSNDPQ